MSTERFNIVFRDYPEEMQLSAAKRPLWIHMSEGDKIPQYIKSSLSDIPFGDSTYTFDTDGWVIDRRNREKLVRNFKTAGKPNMLKINGQSIWDGSVDRHKRNNLKKFLTGYFSPIIVRSGISQLFTKPELFFHFEFIFYMPITLRSYSVQDVDNHSFCYVKAFLDTVQILNIIENDNAKFARGHYSRYVDIPTEEDRRLEVKIHFCKNNERIS